MNPLEKKLRRRKLGPTALIGGAAVSALVFASMGFTQLRIDYTPPPEAAPIQEFYLPPPPPPPPVKKDEAEQERLAISLGIDPDPGPGDVPLGFLQVDFGLKPQQLTQGQFDSLQTVDTYKTDGLEDLSVYDYQDVAEKPRASYTPASLNFDPRHIGRTNKPFSFVLICRITKQGRTENIHIIDCPYPEAIPTIRRWVENTRYEPAKKDGKPVDCLMRRRITYTPAGGGSPFSL